MASLAGQFTPGILSPPCVLVLQEGFCAQPTFTWRWGSKHQPPHLNSIYFTPGSSLSFNEAWALQMAIACSSREELSWYRKRAGDLSRRWETAARTLRQYQWPVFKQPWTIKGFQIVNTGADVWWQVVRPRQPPLHWLPWPSPDSDRCEQTSFSWDILSTSPWR